MYSAILITFLLGIGVGMFLSHRLWRHLWLIELGIGLCSCCFALGVGPLDRALYGALYAGGWGLAGSVATCVVLLIFPAFLIGCSLPLFAGYLGRLGRGRAFSRAYMLYNFGAALTALLIEF